MYLKMRLGIFLQCFTLPKSQSNSYCFITPPADSFQTLVGKLLETAVLFVVLGLLGLKMAEDPSTSLYKNKEMRVGTI